MQARAKDNSKYQDAKSIIKALELYKVDNGTYPPSLPSTGTAVCAAHTNGYMYSTATDNTWLKPLVDGKYLSKVPTPTTNSCTSHYRYLRPNATDYNCPSRVARYYVLEIEGTDGAVHPSDVAESPGNNVWRPCVGATAGWGYGNNAWVFTKDE